MRLPGVTPINAGAGAAPLVTVLIPVYNAAPWLDEALWSVRRQTWTTLDILVIDDGSTDGSAEIIARHAGADARLRVVSRGNLGLVATLNEGLGLARGTYLARFDADDRFEPECIERQVAAMETRPELVVLGVNIWSHRGLRWLGRGVHGETMTRLSLAFLNVVGHPGVMLRRSVLDQHGLRYDPAFYLAEDHDLWARLADIGTVDVLPETLLFYRPHAGALSQRNYARLLDVQRNITVRQFARWFDIRLDDLLPLDNAAWCDAVLKRLLAAPYWQQADAKTRQLLLWLLQDFCLRYGAGQQYLRHCGLRGLVAGRWNGLWFLVRMVARALRAPVR